MFEMFAALDVHVGREVGWIEAQRFAEGFQGVVPMLFSITFQAMAKVCQDVHRIWKRFIVVVIHDFDQTDRLRLAFHNHAIYFSASIRAPQLLERVFTHEKMCVVLLARAFQA